jgi:hypothetical protein
MNYEEIREWIEENVRFLSDGSICEDDNADLESDSKHVLAMLPEDVREWVADNVCFFCPQTARAAATEIRLYLRFAGHQFRPDDYDDENPSFQIRLIYLSRGLINCSTAERHFVIAHEIAHQWNEAIMLRPKSREEQARVEQEADGQAIKWGFPKP